MSMKNLTNHFSTTKTPQTKTIPGREADMAPNSAGGVTFTVDKWTRLQRFLILGSEGGSYYASEQKLTADNATSALDCIAEDGLRVVNLVVEISQAGRAPKNTPALFILAMASKLGDEAVAGAAYQALPKVARFGTHLFQWADAIKAFGGFSSGTQRAISRWYQTPRRHVDVDLTGDELVQATTEVQAAHARWVAMQVSKYQAREGWSHADLLRLAKPGAKSRRVARDPALDKVLDWATGKSDIASAESAAGDASDLLWAFEKAKAIGNVGDVAKVRTRELVSLINDHGLPRECIPTQYLNEVSVWEALLDNRGYGMPMTAMIRNLGKMTSIGLIGPMSAATKTVAARLQDEDLLSKARIHPLQALVALNTYKGGKGIRGSLVWSPESKVTNALDAAFYKSFQSVEPTGKRWMLALDVSGSMTWSNIAGMPGITPRIGSAAMAMITAATEEEHIVTAFSAGSMGVHGNSGIEQVDISPRQRLDDVCNKINGLRAGGTDCSLPMIWALQNKVPVDVFVIYTDSETYAGKIQPVQALREYRQKMGIEARLIVAGMTSNGFTLADPSDTGMLDVVGFDTAAPKLMAEFAKGNL
jgi:60 kDa SS-A/Ro ribonucleoprotein